MTDENADRPAGSDFDAALESIEQSFASVFRFVKQDQRRSAASLDPELQPAAWVLLRQVVREHPVQVGTLAATMGIDKSSASRLLRELRERGLVETTHAAEDARAVLVAPTPEATRRVTEIGARRRAQYRSFFDAWSQEELTEFARLMSRFSAIEEREEAP